MKRVFCDRCGVEHSEEAKVEEYQITAKMEAIEEVDGPDNREYGIEFERMEVCQPCAALISTACREFVKSQIKVPDRG